MSNSNKEITINEQIKLIQKEDISNSEKMKKIQELYLKKNSKFTDQKKEIVCNHYKRLCKIISPCCGKIVPCRICHDENKICSKKFDRFAVKRIICIECSEEQDVSNKCIKCNISFSKNFCGKCNLWTDKDIIHCDDCGICRVGTNLYHCKLCDACYNSEDHECIGKIVSREDKCPVCQEVIFTSLLTYSTLKCGHRIHSNCLESYLQSNFNCPICKKSIFDMTQTWEICRQHKNDFQIPEDLEDMKVNISCFDCGKKKEVKWYPDGLLECEYCGSFNTQKI